MQQQQRQKRRKPRKKKRKREKMAAWKKQKTGEKEQTVEGSARIKRSLRSL
jgi:hypothetical protein